MREGRLVVLTEEALMLDEINCVPVRHWVSLGPLKILEVRTDTYRVQGTIYNIHYFITKKYVQQLSNFKDRIK